jgi:hypothetical protein
LAIGSITRSQIDAARGGAPAAAPWAGQPVRLAVLPHLALDEMSFDPDSPAVQVASDLRFKLKQLPHVEVESPVDIQQQLRRLRAGGLDGEPLMQALAVRLGVDYIVWGEYRSAPPATIQTAVYRREDGQKVVQSGLSADGAQVDLVSRVAGQLVVRTVSAGAENNLRTVLASLTNRQRAELEAPLAAEEPVAAHLRAALEAMEQALAYPLGATEGALLLSRAERHLSAALETDTRNPLGHQLLANVLYNQAQAQLQGGQTDAAEQSMRGFASALRRAYRERERATHQAVQDEIAGDYALLIARDVPAAIAAYQRLLEAPETSLNSALRAHWMLAGIYSGDWQVPPDTADPERARKHVVQILAHWENSSEAVYLKKALRWNDESGSTHYDHLPRPNAPLVREWPAE